MWGRYGLVLFCALISGFLSSGPALAEEGELLLRVDRATRNDLASLLDDGIPVVMEMDVCLFVRGSEGHLRALRDRGCKADLLDSLAAVSDYLVIGLRPDSDLDAVRAVGITIHEEANWILVRVPRDTTFDGLMEAKVFVTRMPREKLEPPSSAPTEHASGSSRAFGLAPADPMVQKIVNQVLPADIDALWADLTSNPPSGTRYSTAQGCRDASSYCLNKYGTWKLQAQYQNWNVSHAPNVVATQEGGLYPSRVYIVEGHLDDLPSSGAAPGADDNASGSVTVLEAAKVMSCWSFKSTVKYLNVTGEEFGLYGSEAYADDAWARGEDVRGVVNMDMNAWQGDGIPNPENLDVDYDGPSEWLGRLFAECATKYGTGLVVDAFYCPSLSASDHYPFWQKGWSAICGITDNEGYCGHGGNYPYYHTSDDTIANCGSKSLFYGAVKTSIATIAELAQPFKVTTGKTAYGCGSSIDFVVGDRDLNANPSVRETSVVQLSSTTEPTPEVVTVTERSVDSPFFDGSMPASPDSPVPGDGRISVLPGDTVTVRYVDALDCDGASNVSYTGTATIDCAKPIISGVGSQSVTDTSAVITWTTDEASSSVVHWGQVVPPSRTSGATGTTTSHSVGLTGLQSCTVYYYDVQSEDVAGNVTRDDSGGNYYHFETYGNFGSGLQPCHAGRVTIDGGVYACSDTLTFHVVDMDLNANSGVAETTTLRVTSSTETIPEIVVVTETGPNTSTFTGSIHLAAGTPATDGTLQVSNGDVTTVTYLDANDGTGAPATAFDTAAIDCAGPGIRNLRVADVTDQRMTVLFDTDEPGTTKIEWGSTPALGQVVDLPMLTTAHSATLNRLAICQPYYIRVSSTDARSNVAVLDQAGQPFRVHTWNIPGLYWRETFEGDVSGWTLQGEWQIGPPEGRGGSSGYPDPTSAYNNTRILGMDLTGLGAYPGDYEHSVTQSAVGPTLDATTWLRTELLLYRQLNVRRDDRAGIVVATRGKEYPVYSSAGATVTENAYSIQSIDVSSLVDGQRSISVRFSSQSDGQAPYSDDGVASGWNVDDVVLKDAAQPDYGPCGGCAAAPAFGGARGAADNNACAATGVTVRWDGAVSWGSGASGTYVVYRDTVPGFAPSAANMVEHGVSALSYNDLSAPTDRDLYYLVRAENNETCSSGPHNGGAVDVNSSYAHVNETTGRPTPATISALRASMINDAHVRLSWEAAAGASSYRIYRSETAQPGGFVLVAETSQLFYEDLNQGGNANTYYYSVRGVNPCGQE